MLYPVAIEIGDANTAYGVAVPDIEGCFSAGDTLDEALANAKEAIEIHLELLAEEGNLPPQGSSLAEWQANPEYQGWAWGVVEVDVEPYMGKASKINVTLPNLLTKQIDDVVEAHAEYKSRSHFLQVAATLELRSIKEKPMYTCPKCHGSNTDKERCLGADTMDRVCVDCGYVGARSEFRQPIKKDNKE